MTDRGSPVGLRRLTGHSRAADFTRTASPRSAALLDKSDIAGERYLSKVIVMKCTPAPKDFHFNEWRGQEGQPNEACDIAHGNTFTRRNSCERRGLSRRQLIKPPARTAKRFERREVDFGPLNGSPGYHQPQLRAAPLKLERDEACHDCVATLWITTAYLARFHQLPPRQRPTFASRPD